MSTGMMLFAITLLISTFALWLLRNNKRGAGRAH
jgi:hypothetical protein